LNEFTGKLSRLRYTFAMIGKGESMEPRKMGAPRHGENAKIQRSIAVDPQLWESAMATAARRQESLSGVISRSLQRYVKRGAAPKEQESDNP